MSLTVPASWPVINLTVHPAYCPRLDRHVVYLGTGGPDPACPASVLTGKTEAVQLMPISTASPDLRAASSRTVIDGMSARTNPDSQITHTIIDILPAAGVEVSLSYGRDLPLVRVMQAAIRITTTRGRGSRLAGAASITPAPVPAAAVQGLYKGPGFDTCAAPSAGTMSRWLASPYRAVGIYIGGVNRACAQANLTAGWITAIQRAGWHYFPFYVGLQASCVQAFGDAPITTSRAAAEGTQAADDAAQQARNLGIPPGTPLIYDMEAYAGCGQQVITFLSAWDAELHHDGYLAGVYESFSNIGDLVSAASRMTEPDVIHYADWDGIATTTSGYMPAGWWTQHQRLHQYLGGHDETWGGVTLNIDDDQLDVNLSGPPSPTPTPPPSPYPFRHEFRIAAGLNSNGSAEWFARGADGTLRHAYQHPVGTSSWTVTRSVGASPANLVSNPAVTADQNGHLTVFAVDSNGQVAHAWQQHGASNGWQWGAAAGTGTPGLVAGDPAAIRLPGGEVAVFVADASGTVMTTRQQAPNSDASWTPWTSIGGSCGSSPVAYQAPAGPAQVFCITGTGALTLTTSTSGSASGWAAWQPVAGLSNLTGVPAVISVGPGQTAVYATTAAGRLDVAWRDAGRSGWTTGTGPAGPAKAGASPAVTSWPGGGVAVLIMLSGGDLGFSVQQPAGSGGWTAWTSLGSSVVGVPAAWQTAPGAVAALLDSAHQIAVASYAGHGWSGWTEVGGGF